MFEAIVTMVAQETKEGITYPITRVYRLEFGTLAAMEYWLHCAPSHTLNIEKLVAES